MSEADQERKVKGTLVIALAMIVNDRKKLDWKGQTKLTDQDLALIKDRIMPSSWYNIDFYERLGSAVFKVAGNSRPEGAYQFGDGVMWNILSKTYANSLLRNNPGQGVKTFAVLFTGNFFNTASAEFKESDAGGVFKISDPFGIPTQESFVPMIKAMLTKLARENGAKGVRVECEQESKLGAGKLTEVNYKITWSKK
jgi:hypothetical protein